MNENLNNQENLNNSQTISSQPTQPVQPTQPAQPSQPAQPTQPVQPTQPAQPTQPVKPTQPAQPTQPVKPTQPAQPTQPVQPTQPAQPTQPVQPTQPAQPEIDDEFKEIKSNKLIIFIIILILLLIGAGVGVFFILNKSKDPQIIFKESLNQAKEQFNELTDSIKTNANGEAIDKMTLNSTIKLNTNIPGLEELQNYKFNLSNDIDYKNKYLSSQIIFGNDNKDIITILTYLVENKMFLETNLLNKVIKIGEDDFSSYFNDNNTLQQDIEDVKYIVNKLIDYTNESLIPEKFEKANEKITINDKDLEVIANTYILDSDSLNTMNKSIIDKILSDDKFIEILAKLNEYTIEETKEQLNNDKNYSFEESNYKAVIYTYKNKFVGFKFYDDINYINYTNYENIQNFVINSENEEIITAKIDQNNITFCLNVDEDSITINYDKITKIANITLNMNNEILNIKLKVNYDKISENEYNYKIDLTLNFTNESQDIEISANIDMTQYINKDIEINKPNSYIETDELTEQDYQEILTNLYKNIEGTSLEYLLNSLLMGNDNSLGIY